VTLAGIAAARLAHQRITKPGPRDPAASVAWFGAVQAQEYGAAKWALGLRMREGITEGQIERACDEGRILRTHALRPTWHFVAAADIRWLLDLTAPQVHRKLNWGHTQLGTHLKLRTRAMAIIERALTDEPSLTRPELQRTASRGEEHVRAAAAARAARADAAARRSARRADHALLPQPRAGNRPRLRVVVGADDRRREARARRRPRVQSDDRGARVLVPSPMVVAGAAA